MKRYLAHMIKSEEARVDLFLKEQVKDPARPDRGLMAGRIIDVKQTAYLMTTAIAVYLRPDSRYFQDKVLYAALLEAADAILRLQRDNGFFDYPVCNFYSAPDTAFSFKRLYAGYRLMEKYADATDMGALREKYLQILHRAAAAICFGGFHTPNHRWAICAALASAANLFGEEEEFAGRMRDRIGQFLREGIDCNADGEYAERSTGNYNAVVNSAMMTMAEELGSAEYLGYVEKNLNALLCYIEPDDTIFTENSTRQDRGKEVYADKYFYQFLYLAAMDREVDGFACSPENHALFDAAAHKIIHDNLMRGDEAPNCLHILMLHERMLSYEFAGYGFPQAYKRLFADSGVLRVRREKYAYTLIRGASAFLYLNAGGLEVCLKIGEAYCDIRNFVPKTLDVEEKQSTLSVTYGGWYYQPWREKPETSDWWQMDHKKRELMYTSELTTRVCVTEEEDGLAIGLDTEGLDRLPLRVELCVPAGITLENPHFYFETTAGGECVVRDDVLRLHKGGTCLLFGPCFGEHEFPGHYSGEEPNTEGFTVYCNAYTPVHRQLRLKIVH